MNRQVNRQVGPPSQQQIQPQQNNEQNLQNIANSKPEQKQKKKKRQTALRPEHFETGKGLKKLYQLSNQIKWDDPMTTQSAMNLVVMTLKTWQYQLMPKYSYQYFWKRCQALGNDKLVSAYMGKTRRIHKGLDRWDQPVENKDPNKIVNGEQKRQKEQSDHEGIDLNNPNINDQNYDNYQDEENQFSRFRERAQIAKKLTTKEEKKANGVNEQVDQLMDEDLRMFQQMNRQRENKNNNKNKRNQDDEDQGIDIAPDSGIDFDNYYDD